MNQEKVGIIISVLSSVLSFGQNQVLNEKVITSPSFQGELYNSFDEFLKSELKYSVASYNKCIQGTEIIQFAVLPSGNISNINIVDSLSEEIDKKITRILELTDGKWKPGTVAGEPAEMEKEVAVQFCLQSSAWLIVISGSPVPA